MAALQTASRGGAMLMPIGASLPSAREIPNATTPNPDHDSRYPATSAATWAAALPCRRDRRTVRYIDATGATDGRIIAAIMTTHSRRNSPNTSHGPAIDAGIPGSCRISSTQATAATTSSPAHRAGLLRLPGELAEVAIFAGVVERQAVVRVAVAAGDAALRAGLPGASGRHEIGNPPASHTSPRAVGARRRQKWTIFAGAGWQPASRRARRRDSYRQGTGLSGGADLAE